MYLEQLIVKGNADEVAKFLYENFTMAEIDLLVDVVDKLKNGKTFERKAKGSFVTETLHKDLAKNFVQDEIDSWNILGYDVFFYTNEADKKVSISIEARDGLNQYFGYAYSPTEHFDVDNTKALAIAKLSYDDRYEEVLKNNNLEFLLN